MSYSIRIVDKNTNETIQLKQAVPATGGTYCPDSNEAWFNITYNYRPIFVKLFGEDGIRSIYGKDINETLPILDNAAKSLNSDVADDYWKLTEGNVRLSLEGLVAIAKAAVADYPDHHMIWSGD